MINNENLLNIKDQQYKLWVDSSKKNPNDYKKIVRNLINIAKLDNLIIGDKSIINEKIPKFKINKVKSKEYFNNEIYNKTCEHWKSTLLRISYELDNSNNIWKKLLTNELEYYNITFNNGEDLALYSYLVGYKDVSYFEQEELNLLLDDEYFYKDVINLGSFENKSEINIDSKLIFTEAEINLEKVKNFLDFDKKAEINWEKIVSGVGDDSLTPDEKKYKNAIHKWSILIKLRELGKNNNDENKQFILAKCWHNDNIIKFKNKYPDIDDVESMVINVLYNYLKTKSIYDKVDTIGYSGDQMEYSDNFKKEILSNNNKFNKYYNNKYKEKAWILSGIIPIDDLIKFKDEFYDNNYDILTNIIKQNEEEKKIKYCILLTPLFNFSKINEPQYLDINTNQYKNTILNYEFPSMEIPNFY